MGDLEGKRGVGNGGLVGVFIFFRYVIGRKVEVVVVVEFLLESC